MKFGHRESIGHHYNTTRKPSGIISVGLFDLGAYLVGKETFGESVIIHRGPVETTSSPKEKVILD